jgi:predicted ATPase
MIPTRWSVITGAPTSGKTTIIMALGQLGFKHTSEVARPYIESQIASGISLEEIKKDLATFQRSLSGLYLKAELELNPQDIVFLDRAMPDDLSYHKLFGTDSLEIMDQVKKFRYEHVFLFDRLPFQNDGVRVDDEKAAQFLDKQLEIDYQSLGYSVIRVPAMSIEERLQFVLNTVQAKPGSPTILANS